MSPTLIHLIIFSTLNLYRFQFIHAGSSAIDHQALLEIRAKITDDPLGVMSSWNETTHFCEWHGVSCGRQHRRVVELQLSSSKIRGSLSPYIGNLSFLRVIHFENNSLSGIIPPEIAKLNRLQYLFLQNNSLSGEIPSNISGCSSLVGFVVQGNKLVGHIPPELGSLLHLQYLYMSINNLTGTIPSTLGNLSSLVVLAVTTNNLVGIIPDSLGNLKNLSYLALRSNNLSGQLPHSIFNLSSMMHLDLALNHFEGSLPSDLGNTLPNLQFFSIAVNQFGGVIPVSISNSSSLEYLQLASNKFQGQVPSLEKLNRLTHFTLNDNFLGIGEASDLDFVSSLVNATMLQALLIGQNNFTGFFPEVICNFSMLMILGVQNNKIAGKFPNCIERLIELQLFTAWGNQLSSVLPLGIGNLKNLAQLDLAKNQLSGSIPSTIGNLTKLTVLNLQGNAFEGRVPSALGKCSSLLGLDLSDNNLSGNIPSELFFLSTLSIGLIMSNNHLNGSLPMEIGHLNNLGVLDVSGNLLSGEIPSSLSDCVGLEILHLEKNSFRGPIPDALKSVNGLSELDLSENSFSGEIPKFLGSMQLKMLNLSYNNLEGEVPFGGVFENATGFSVAGNNRLCGGIPGLRLPKCTFHSAQKSRTVDRKRVIIAIFFGVLGVILLLACLYALCYRKSSEETSALFNSETSLSHLSYKSLLKATDGFSSENLIGSGSFGDVYKGTLDTIGGEVVAIKTFKLEHHGASKSFLAECTVLQNIRHRNLVKIITACSSLDYHGNEFKALVYEYMANGSLDDWLHLKDNLVEDKGIDYATRNLNFHQRVAIAVDVAFALEYLHHHCGTPIVHCDLKPSNVLLDYGMVAHVADFGLAKFLPNGISKLHANASSNSGLRGTTGYTAPEYDLGQDVSTYGDVYSFGILLLEVFTGRRPTSAMFDDGLTLPNFVKAAIPENLQRIIDHSLLEELFGENINRTVMVTSLVSILEIALSCSAEVPKERLDMRDVAASLSSIKEHLE